MDVCKCIVSSRQGCTINIRRAASPLMKLVEKEEIWEAPDYPQVYSHKIGVELSQIVLSPEESGVSVAQFYNVGKSTISDIKKAKKLQKTGFQMLNDDEIVTSVQEESDPVDNETDVGEDNNNNESSKGPSNADTFSALETATE
ncbi:HTH psq-type domain-containing protein [Trichonephila clavipes]|nr:HTH psq-type domain-containing protein [Trichonephila clavipes]